MPLNLTLNEIEIVLLIWDTRRMQQLGSFAESARKKLLQERARLMESGQRDTSQMAIADALDALGASAGQKPHSELSEIGTEPLFSEL
jgi:hypothetical protein